MLSIDNKYVNEVRFIREETGVNGAKNMNGRNRTILIDTLGLPFSIKVIAAHISDNQATILAIDVLKWKVPRLQKITVDFGYKNTFQEYIEVNYKGEVERSYGWLNFRRRLFRDVEKTVLSAEAMLQIALISFIINEL